jgi:hypothetical protein
MPAVSFSPAEVQAMSLQMFMKMEGVSGGSAHFQYKGWCDVLSWNWGMTSNRKSTQGNGEDKTSLNEISVIKPIGIDSPAIRLLFAQGKSIPSVEFSVTPVMNKREVQTKYISMRMEDVVIKSIISGGGVDDKFFKEHLTLCFDRINFEYSQNAQVSNENGAGSAAVEYNFRWQVSSNSELQQ